MTKKYIEKHFSEIKKYANIIETRVDDSFCTEEMMIKENAINLEMCKKHDCEYILIDEKYEVNIKL